MLFMKRLLLLSVIFISCFIQIIQAQCPPPGFPQPGNSCTQAPILCPNLDGYCATINNSNTAQNFPGCPGWQLNNDEWFAFFAGSTTISMTVTPSNCSPGANQGLQGGIYRNCVNTPLDLQCSCTENPFELTSNNFIVGQVYYIVMDGCGGNVCDYSIDVTQGSTVGVPPNPPGPITGPATICAGSSAGYSIATVPVATSYTWTLNPPVGTVTSNGVVATVNIPAGATTQNTQLCVTAANACFSNTTPSCIDIDVIPRPTATISGSGIICAGGTGMVNLTVTFTGEGPWTFIPRLNGVNQPAITTNDNPYTYTVSQIGNYTLNNVTGGSTNCVGTVSGTSAVTASTVTTTVASTGSTCGLENGAINLTVGGTSTPPYTFAWSNSATTEDLTNVVGGTSYTVTVTSNNGCTTATTVNVPNTNPLFVITPTIVSNTTCIDGNGSISINVTPANTYTYEWSNAATTSSITMLPAGSYTVTVNGGGLCTQTASFNVPNAPVNPSASFTTVPTTCELSNGTVNLNVSGGLAPFTFIWGDGETTQNLTMVPAGPYAVTVTGANGCTTSTSVTLANNNPPINVSQTVVANTTCNGGNGSVTLNATPAGAYTYTWDTGATTSSLTGLAPGGYSATVSAGGACTTVVNVTIPDQPSLPNVTSSTVGTTCELSNGSVNISVSGGVAPYTFLWDGGATTQNLPNVSAGSYTLVVTGANGCTRTITATVNNTNPPITINSSVVNNTTCNGGNGSISLNVTPPLSTYTYLWDTGATTSSLTGLTPGSYAVTVQGNGTCTQTANINVNDNPNRPNVTASAIQSTCELNNGAINVSVSGGVAPYTFSWNTGQTSQNLTAIPAGSYDLTVTGANGCTREISVTVNNINPNINVNTNVVPNTSCNSSGTGAVTLIVTPPAAYTYLWSNNATTSSLTNLLAGTYQVTVSAGGACTEVVNVDILDDPREPELDFTTIDARCGLNNGSINLSVSNGVAPYTYQWATGQITQDLFNLLPDTYIVTVTGANGCSNVGIATVDDSPIDININYNVVANTSCTAVGNGSITLSITPTTTTVSWSSGQNTKSISNLLPGEYTVTVSAGGTCTEVLTITVDDESEEPSLSYEVTEAICGLPNGAIDLSVDDGVTPYTYTWSSGQMVQDLTNRLAGTYTVIVTTARGCTATVEATIPNNDPGITILATVFENTSCTAPNGTIYTEIVPEGYSYTYKWNNNSMSPNLLNVGTGNYTVTVTLGTCIVSETIEMTTNAVPPNLAVAGTAATCGVNNGSATANASAGVTPYTYQWSTSATTATINNLTPGVYTVTVRGGNGCSTTATTTIGNNSIALNISGVIVENTSCVAGNGGINITATPTGSYTYAWSNAAITEDITSLAEGIYTVTVTAGPTCSASATFIVVKNTSDPVITPIVTPDICAQSIGAIDLSLTGGGGGYIYLWNNSAVSEDLTSITSGTYTVTVTASNGCTATEVLTVANNSNTFSLSGAATPLTNCAASNGSINLIITPSGPYQINWSTSSVTEDLVGLSAGTYTVTVTQSGSCTASLTFVVEDNLTYPSLNTVVTSEICGLNNGALSATTTGGTMPYAYVWSSGQTTEDLTNISANFYTLTVTDINNCTATTAAVVPNNSIAFALDGVTTANTSCGTNNGAIQLNVSPANGNYTYLWSNTSLLEDLVNIDGGDYSVTVSAGGTCTNIASFVVLDNTLSPIIVESVTAAQCAKANGAISLNVTGSTMPYTYNWSNNATTTGLNNILAGTYTVTVTGADACTTENTITIPDNAFSPSISGTPVENTSCTSPNGSISISVTPADTYTYTWASGQTANAINALQAGTYTVTVSAGGACTAVSNFTVDNNTQSPTIANVIAPSVCSQPVGGINITVSGGVAPFTYLWNNNVTTEDLSNLLAGSYTVTVRGANGCTSTATYTVTNESNNFNIAEFITPNSSCTVGNGSINLTVVPLGTYTYKWSNNAVLEDLSGLLPGTFTVTVTDASGCAISEVYTLTANIQPVTLSGIKTDILCFGDKSGSIDLTVDTGTPTYTYNWQPAQAGNPEDLVSIGAGNYQVTVTDIRNCTATITFTVIQPPTDNALDCDQSKTVSIPGASDGEGSVTITGGTPPYNIEWTPGSTATNLQPGVFKIQNLVEGSYAVTVTDANGCPVQCGFSIGLVDCETEVGTMSSLALAKCGATCITATYNSTGQFLDPTDILQFVLHTGSSNLIVNELARNTQPVFCFNPATMTYGTTYYISAVAGNNDGTGNVVLNDFCTVVSFGTPIVFNEKPDATALPVLPISCANKQVSVTGASSIAGSVFDWTATLGGTIIGNNNTATINAGTAGNYQLITTANGCKDTVVVAVNDITNTPIATILADPNDILDCKIDQIILAGGVEGTSNPNTVWYSNGIVFSNNNPVPVGDPGTYTFILVDTLTFCADTATIVINENQAFPPLSIANPATITCAQPIITLTGSSPFVGILFKWARINGTDTTIISNTATVGVSQAGVYYLIGIDPANTCTNIESVTVTSNQALPTVDAGSPFNMDCFGETLPLSGVASGSSTNLAITWSTNNGNILSGNTTLTPLITLPGTYTLVVTDNVNGCKASDDVIIPPDAPVANLLVEQPACYGELGRIVVESVSGGAPPVNYSLNNGGFTTKSDFNNLTGGTYTLLVKDAQGCTTTAEATITVPPLFDITLLPDVLIKIGEAYEINVDVNVPLSEIRSVKWTPSDRLSCDTCLNTIATPLKQTGYEVVAINQNGCEDREYIVIRVDTRLDIYVPNIFSPDVEGENSKLTIYADPSKRLKIKTFQIFSRWGEKVFERNNFDPNLPDLGWDGKFGTVSLNPAVFVWYAIIIGPAGDEILLEGDVTLER